MSSYKGHSIFALLLSLLFFQNPILITLVLIGANIPDFDHKFKKEKDYRMIIFGLVVFICLYIMKLHYYLGLIIVFLGVVFLFSEHRSFTHSIFGLLTITASLSLILIFAFNLVVSFTDIPNLNNYYLFLVIVILLAFLFFNKKLFLIFLPLLLISFLFLPIESFNYLQIALAIFIGLLSHIALDSFTPAGIKPLAPISSKKVYKKFGIITTILIILMAIIYGFYAESSLLYWIFLKIPIIIHLI